MLSAHRHCMCTNTPRTWLGKYASLWHMQATQGCGFISSETGSRLVQAAGAAAAAVAALYTQLTVAACECCQLCRVLGLHECHQLTMLQHKQHQLQKSGCRNNCATPGWMPQLSCYFHAKMHERTCAAACDSVNQLTARPGVLTSSTYVTSLTSADK